MIGVISRKRFLFLLFFFEVQDETIFADRSTVNGVDLPAQALRSALSQP